MNALELEEVDKILMKSEVVVNMVGDEGNETDLVRRRPGIKRKVDLSIVLLEQGEIY